MKAGRPFRIPHTVYHIRPVVHTAGFSLIEILVSIALISILAGIGVTIFAVINNAASKSKAISEIQSQTSAVMEGLQRSIRSSDSVTSTPASGCSAGASACLWLTFDPASIEHEINGGCSVTEYAWFAPTASANGRLQRSWKNTDGSLCGGGGVTDLFNTDPSRGISIELLNLNDSSIFTVNTPSSGLPWIRLAFSATQGVNLKGGTDNRAKVPFVTSVSLRESAE